MIGQIIALAIFVVMFGFSIASPALCPLVSLASLSPFTSMKTATSPR